MKKKVVEIENVNYGENDVSCEPSRDEIKKAIREDNFETRAFQHDLYELKAEWKREARNFQDYCNLLKKYHTRRIAYFVVNGWKDPIILHSDAGAGPTRTPVPESLEHLIRSYPNTDSGVDSNTFKVITGT